MSAFEGQRLLAGAPGSKVKLTDHSRRQHGGAPRHRADARGAADGRRQEPPAGRRHRLRARRRIRPPHGDQLRSQIASLAKGGATTADHRRPQRRRRRSRRRRRGRAAVRRLGHARRPRIALDGQTKIAAEKGDGAITLPVTAARRLRHLGSGRNFRRGAGRQQARRAHRRAHGRPDRRPGAREAARRQRALDYIVPLSDARWRAASGQGPGARRCRRSARRRLRRAAPPTRFFSAPSNALPRKPHSRLKPALRCCRIVPAAGPQTR